MACTRMVACRQREAGVGSSPEQRAGLSDYSDVEVRFLSGVTGLGGASCGQGGSWRKTRLGQVRCSE